ncbi:glycosyltransferase [Paenibacillus montanisoli]|uniref:Glycosyltransferase subfamily 4-like N-terminal domain-containing protein n=1 Tax=Paenibacillus montanisoli TaxID=2081970 RepID=A0A328TUL9_9BACL|nr:glycosyltransferase [Paenibacillus montanisoli]RAP74010.1 hypothetical protein DL346_23325 [Paenibacillus montanisoli]
MKTILFLVGEKLSANGICADAVMNEFSSMGYKVLCITNEEYKSSKSEISNGIHIVRIKPRLTYRMNNWCNNNTGAISWIVRKLSFVLNKFKLILSIPTWPLISPMYAFRFYRAASKMYNTSDFDCIIPIYTQIDTIIAGYFLKKKHPELKFVPYFLDSLSGGYGPKKFSKNWIVTRGIKWERRLLKNADKIIVMKASQEHHDLYTKNEGYYSRMRILDIPLLTSFKSNNNSPSSKILDTNQINLVYVGSIPIHIRNPKYILEVFSRLNIDNCTLTLIGTNTCPDLIKEAQKNSTKNRIRVINSIPHAEVISVLRDADFLINIGNNISTMVPSKIFEYMTTGKPIISTYPIENEPSLSYLKQYPLSLLLNENREQINEDTLKLENFIQNSRGKSVNLQGLKESMYYNTPQAFVKEIETLF